LETRIPWHEISAMTLPDRGFPRRQRCLGRRFRPPAAAFPQPRLGAYLLPFQQYSCAALPDPRPEGVTGRKPPILSGRHSNLGWVLRRVPRFSFAASFRSAKLGGKSEGTLKSHFESIQIRSRTSG